MFCGNCGKKLIDGSLFCMECGTPVPAGRFAGTQSAAQQPSFSNGDKFGNTDNSYNAPNEADLFGTNSFSEEAITAFSGAMNAFGAQGFQVPTVEDVDLATGRVRQKAPKNKGDDILVENFSMTDGKADTEFVPNSLPVIEGCSMDEDESKDVILDPYRFLGDSMEEMSLDSDNSDNADNMKMPSASALTAPEPLAVEPVSFAAAASEDNFARLAAEPDIQPSVSVEPVFPNQPEPVNQPEIESVSAAASVPEIQPEAVQPKAPSDQPDSIEAAVVGQVAVAVSDKAAVPIVEPITAPVIENITKVEPVAVPKVEPVAAPAAEPVVAVPTVEPVAVPTVEPVAAPTAEPVAVPKVEPVAVPTVEPVAVPKVEPVAAPTAEPVAAPKNETVADPEPAVEEFTEPFGAPVIEQVDDPAPQLGEPPVRQAPVSQPAQQPPTPPVQQTPIRSDLPEQRDTYEPMPPAEKKKGIPVWLFILVLLGLIAAVVIIFLNMNN